MKVNLKDVKGSTFDPIPEGLYQAVVDKTELTAAKDSGNPMIKVTLKITDGDFKNRFVWDNFVLIENSLWKLKGFFAAAKSDLVESTSVSEQELAAAMSGVHVGIYLEPRVGNNGQATSNVKNYRAAEGEDTPSPTAPRKTSSILG
jgi:hypothetical protein